jgi:hypothetical protein
VAAIKGQLPISSENVKVIVKDGGVTLEGTVPHCSSSAAFRAVKTCPDDWAVLLLADLGIEQITDDTLGFVLAFDGRGHDLVKSGLHAVELELSHEVEELSSFHQLVLLRLS